MYLASEIHIDKACLYNGLLVEEQHCIGIDREMNLDISKHCFIKNFQGHIPIAVFNVSLAGDQEDGFSEKLALESLSSRLLQQEATHQQLLNLGRTLIESNIGMLLCQKCVHSSLRDLLEKHVSPVLYQLLYGNVLYRALW